MYLLVIYFIDMVQVLMNFIFRLNVIVRKLNFVFVKFDLVFFIFVSQQLCMWNIVVLNLYVELIDQGIKLEVNILIMKILSVVGM